MLTIPSNLFRRSPAPGPIRRHRKCRIVPGRFDVARTTPENRKHWAAPDGHSADPEAGPEGRKALRGPLATRRPTTAMPGEGHRAHAGERYHRHGPAPADSRRRRRPQPRRGAWLQCIVAGRPTPRETAYQWLWDGLEYVGPYREAAAPRRVGNDTIRAALSAVSLPGVLNNVANKRLLLIVDWGMEMA